MPDFKQLRSLNSNVKTSCAFRNTSERTVYLYWLNTEGKLVRYDKLLPNGGTGMDTFVTHPWIVRDAESFYPLRLNGENIYYPRAEENGQVYSQENRHRVKITIPVYPLLRRCLEVIGKTGKKDAIRDLAIPRDRRDRLLRMVPSPENTDHKKCTDEYYEDFAQW